MTSIVETTHQNRSRKSSWRKTNNSVIFSVQMDGDISRVNNMSFTDLKNTRLHMAYGWSKQYGEFCVFSPESMHVSSIEKITSSQNNINRNITNLAKNIDPVFKWIFAGDCYIIFVDPDNLIMLDKIKSLSSALIWRTKRRNNKY